MILKMKTLKYAMATALVALTSVGLHAQSNGTWTTYNTKNSEIGGNNISAIAADSKGVWVGTYQGLCRLNGAEWLDYAMFNEKLKDQSVNCLMTDKRGVVWIGTDDYGVIEFDGTHWTEYATETRRLKMKFIKEIMAAGYRLDSAAIEEDGAATDND